MSHLERHLKARRPSGRRAFSLLEMLAVLALMGLVAGMAITRFGHSAYQAADAEGFARRLSLDLAQTRRRAIATGDDHYLQFHRTAGVVTSYAVYRNSAGGAFQVDDAIAIPAGATVTPSSDIWTYDFTSAISSVGANSTIRVDGAKVSWHLTLYHATGSAEVDKLPL